MILNSRAIDDIQKLFDSGKALPEVSFESLTLGGLLELTSSYAEWSRVGNTRAVEFWAAWARVFPCVNDAWKAMSNGHNSYEDPHLSIVPRFELRSIQGRDDLLKWTLFEERFQRALVSVGFDRETAYGFAGAFQEMADNVVQHSGYDSNGRVKGVAAYLVGPGMMSYAVADVGRGVLASLIENPNWRNLSTSSEALTEAVLNQASRRERIGDDAPCGFPRVLESLTNMRCQLRFRSGDGLLALDGRTWPLRPATKLVPERPGLQLSVFCNLHSDEEPALTEN